MESMRVLFMVATIACISAASRIPRQDETWIWDMEPINCVRIENCKILSDYIAQHQKLSDEIKTIMKQYSCGQDSGGVAKVNCPNTLPPEFAFTDDSSHPNYKLLPGNCGKLETRKKIVGGLQADLFEFPWAVTLKYDKIARPYSCGGSLISERYVLTAANCITSQSKIIGVRLGEHNFNTDPDCDDDGKEKICAESPQDFDVDKNDVIIHPDYNRLTVQDNIALIRLRRPANTTVDSVGTICLPITVPEKTKVFDNFTIIGWGATETGFSSPILVKAAVSRVDLLQCAKKYEQNKLTIKHFCAGSRNEQDSCAGDSGGPLSADYFADGIVRTIQYGIISFGPRICGRENFPAVYTRVNKYTKWILDNMRP